MKKIILIIAIFILVGCSEEQIKTAYKFDDSLYKINTPYKKAINNYSEKSYNKENVEKMLFKIANSYFKTNVYTFEEGQYLTTDEIKMLLDNISENIIAVHEQNYISGTNTGILISLIAEVNIETILTDIEYVYNYLVSKHTDKKVIITVYEENTGLLEGNIKYIYDGQLNHVNYNYQYLDSSYIMNNDLNSYNAFIDIKNKVPDYDIYIKGVGLYKNNELIETTINISNGYLSTSEVLNISQNITETLNNFNDSVIIKVYFNSNNKIKAVLTKEENFEIDLELMEE